MERYIWYNYAPINVKPLGGGGRLGIGGAFELRVSVQISPTPGHLWIVKMATKSQ